VYVTLVMSFNIKYAIFLWIYSVFMMIKTILS